MGKKVPLILFHRGAQISPLRSLVASLCVDLTPMSQEYGLPMDDQELDRMDLCHTKYFSLLKQRRFLSPISENPQRILDLGCGTGSLNPGAFYTIRRLLCAG
jgi:hypothetical protein